MSKLGSRAFFSFSRLTDQTKHRAYGEWHALDHMPENVALEGVALGTRWVRTPECAARTAASTPDLAEMQYLTTYWFRDPHQESIRVWDDLASASRHWGRRPELAWTQRLRRGYHVPTKGYVNPAALVPADVLPFRPTTGAYLLASRFVGAPVDVVELMQWYDQERIPELVTAPGAAGAWSFVTEDTFAQDRKSPEMTAERVLLVYLDGDPLAYADALGAVESERAEGIETVLMATPLVTVRPWTWDWFD